MHPQQIHTEEVLPDPTLLGHHAPKWTLNPGWQNSIQSPEELHGRWAILLFFNIGCPGCTGRALPFARELLAQFPELSIVGIHTDFESYTPLTRIKTVMDYLDPPYPIVCDYGDSTFRRYYGEGTPQWIIVEPSGVVHRSIFGSIAANQQRIDYVLREVFQV
ncbi:MAG: redoxin domain-containing protein [Chloroflexota bacterium]